MGVGQGVGATGVGGTLVGLGVLVGFGVGVKVGVDVGVGVAVSAGADVGVAGTVSSGTGVNAAVTGIGVCVAELCTGTTVTETGILPVPASYPGSSATSSIKMHPA